MTDPSDTVAVYARVPLTPATDPPVISDAVERHFDEGAVGVVLEPWPGVLDGCSAALGELLETIGGFPAVGKPLGVRHARSLVGVRNAAEAELALGAGAGGLLVAPDAAPTVQRILGEEDLLWVTRGSGGDPAEGVADRDRVGHPWSDHARLVIECRPGAVGALIERMGSTTAEPGPGSPTDAPGPIRVGCALPATGAVEPGTVEALTAIAVHAGARILRCHDTRIVRRCADVATDLVRAGGDLDPPRIGVPA